MAARGLGGHAQEEEDMVGRLDEAVYNLAFVMHFKWRCLVEVCFFRAAAVAKTPPAVRRVKKRLLFGGCRGKPRKRAWTRMSDVV